MCRCVGGEDAEGRREGVRGLVRVNSCVVYVVFEK